jgi:flagellar basal-body rod modification protein FlgD
MATNAITPGSASGPAAATNIRRDRGISSMKSEDFFKLLVTELRQQDPFEPAKTGDMIGQVSQIRSIELSTALTSSLEQLSQQQRTAGASELLGKYVTASVPGADGRPSEVSGVVTGVRFNPDGTAVLELDSGASVMAAHVTRVTTLEHSDPPAAPSGGSPAAPPGGSAPPQNESAARLKHEPAWKRVARALVGA